MTTSFAELFEESLKKVETRPGSIIKGSVVSIDNDMVIVDAGLKSESFIPIEQFKNSSGKLEVKVGDMIDVSLDAIEDGFGETVLSREKAKRHESWVNLEKAHKELRNVRGVINGKVKGGFTVELNDIRAFLPGSLVDVRPVRDTLHLEGKNLDFKVIKLDQKRNNVVVSRKAVIELENNAERDQLLKNLQEGNIIKGMVKNLTDYGAFIDLGGVDGLLHITDMAWKRVQHPSEIVKIGDTIKVKVLKFDEQKTRVSLGLKQLGIDPWTNLTQRYPEGSKHTGYVTNLTDYGCFVEIEEGVEGLVHVSEMDWTNKNIHPSKVVKPKEKINVSILNIDESRRRISLGIKQCKINPWNIFAEKNNKGCKVSGKIKSITDFGIFIGLKGGIDGLVHLSDLSWFVSGDKEVKKYKKGQNIEAIVLQVDSVRERISLGIKQLQEDPFYKYISNNQKNTAIFGVVKSIEEKAILLKIEKGILGCLKLANIPSSYRQKYISDLSIGNTLLVQILGFDKKNRTVYVSITEELHLKNMQNFSLQENSIDFKKNDNTMTQAFEDAKN
ncbi:30S ribosomal protein S1 [Buchnera aphidicola]|uniref:30S ribosomal protein S1 n=1 Tax=Buchnera aphidicola (Cinara cf. splendens/pseudotsugae 3390) TaxID=2518980 RepID=A0A451CXD0_9GAMM|nr:30S ribosomal protein S1 [Buchnera aphidicola]VFP77779.1 30S ribosomal protein S1 [Buchnera aphidicola (Cinara cf. splendens/pseudotsugae 3390)]